MTAKKQQFNWHSQTAFILVAAGLTLSLNEFLIFPPLVGNHGGGAFLLLYMLFLFALGLPLLIAELMVGRMTRLDPSAGLQVLSGDYRASVYWKLVGVFSMLAAFLIVSTLTVVSGWSLAYAVKSIGGSYSGLGFERSRELFEAFTGDSERMALWHSLFVILVVAVISRSLKKGAQRVVIVIVPVMILLLLISLTLALTSSGIGASIHDVLYADFERIDASVAILALQRAFYTLTLGLGAAIALGRYLPPEVPIGYSAGLVVSVDLLFSIFAALMINAFVSSANQLTAVDGHMVFHQLPVIFDQFSSGHWFSAIVFLMMTIAGLTTSVILLQSPLSMLMRKTGLNRLHTAIWLGIAVWLLGLGIILAQGVWNGNGFTVALFFGDEAVRLINNAGFNDVIIFVASHLLQPVAALFLCLFVAWVMPRQISYQELSPKRFFWFEMWNYLLRYITPVLLIVVILSAVGII